ncbi:MAG: carboxymuconolactone decarboxylase family protein [Vicinamibacterales bacterium]
MITSQPTRYSESRGVAMHKLMFMLVVMVVGMAASSRGQDRMPPIPADKLTAAQKNAIEEFKAARSADISGPFVPLLRSPEVMSRARAMGDYLRFKSALPPRLSEFVILLTARRWTQQYEWHVHQAFAIKGGLRREIVDAVAAGRRPARMAKDEDAVYTLCDEVQGTHAAGDATYQRAVAELGEPGVIDALGITGYYTMLAMVMNTARTPLPDGVKPPLAPLTR